MKNVLALILGLPAGIITGMALAYVVPSWVGRIEWQIMVGGVCGTLIGGLVGAICGGELNAQETGIPRMMCGALMGALGGILGASNFQVLDYLRF